MRRRTALATALVVATIAGCGTPHTVAPGLDTGTTVADTTADGTGATDDLGTLPLPLDADRLGEAFAGLYVASDVVVTDLDGTGTALRLRSPYGCDQLWLQLMSGDWEWIDQFTPVVTEEGATAGIQPEMAVVRSGDRIATLALGGLQGCVATLVAAAPGATIELSGMESPTAAWAATSSCKSFDGTVYANVAVIGDNGSGATVEVAVTESTDTFATPLRFAVLGRGERGWLRLLSEVMAMGEAAQVPAGGIAATTNGEVEVTAAAGELPSGTVTIAGTAYDFTEAAVGTASLSFAYHCTEVVEAASIFG